MKRALVLSGGGSRGAYEIGAWQAFEELGVRFQGVYGTSIGAINALLFAHGDLESAVRLWDGITIEKVTGIRSEDFIAVDNMISRKRELLPFLLEHVGQLRMDISPLENLLRQNVEEGRIRASGLSLGIMTVRFPALTPLAVRLKSVPEGKLVDYAIASASCFPVFATRSIDSERYVDGGYYDNLPIDMALEDGAQEIVAVDLHPKPTHPEYANMPFLTVVSPLKSLGGFLDFNPERIHRNRLLGYYDAMKRYGRFDGVRCTFLRQGELRLQRPARRYMHAIAAFDARAVARVALNAQQAHAPLISVLSSDTPGRALSWKEVFLRGLELAALCAGYSEYAIYDAGDLTRRLLELVREKGEAVDAELSERALYVLAHQGDRELMGYLYRWLKRNGSFDGEAVRLVMAYPAQTAAALYLIHAENAV